MGTEVGTGECLPHNHTAPAELTVEVIPECELRVASSAKILREDGKPDMFVIPPNFNVDNYFCFVLTLGNSNKAFQRQGLASGPRIAPGEPEGLCDTIRLWGL